MNIFAQRVIEELNAMYSLGLVSGTAQRAAVSYVEANESEFDESMSSEEGANLALKLVAAGGGK